MWCGEEKGCVGEGECQVDGEAILGGFSPKCKEGEEFCLKEMKCKKIKDEEELYGGKGESCPRGTHYCLYSGQCLSDEEEDDKDWEKYDIGCPDGFYFCLASGECKQDEEKTDDMFENFGEVACSAGQTYCFELGRCSSSCGVQVGEGELIEEGSMIQCSAGEIYCIEQRRCSADCRSEDWNGTEEDEEFFSAVPSCPPSMVYCLASQSCIFDNDNDDIIREFMSGSDDDDDGMDSFKCQAGTVYCFRSGECEEDCDGPGRTLEEEGPGAWSTCPDGQVYCLAVQACVSDCGFFSDGTQSADECPSGTVRANCVLDYCL